MPTLLETERMMYGGVVGRDAEAAALQIIADGISPQSRVGIHRNNFLGALTAALGQSFPAVHRLVGEAFFDRAAALFIETSPPNSAYLNEYGADFPAFLARFPPAAALAYLGDVARLEWAVNCAFHAPDAEPLDLSRLAALPPDEHARVAFVPHPSLRIVHANHPVEEIWRAVLAADDAAMAVIDPRPSPVWLLVQRTDLDVSVERVGTDEAEFLAILCAGRSLQEALQRVSDFDASAALSRYLATGRFVEFTLIEHGEARHLAQAPR
jgi:Putative DNA-binding domain